jgi:hypothetical protein
VPLVGEAFFPVGAAMGLVKKLYKAKLVTASSS